MCDTIMYIPYSYFLELEIGIYGVPLVPEYGTAPFFTTGTWGNLDVFQIIKSSRYNVSYKGSKILSKRCTNRIIRYVRSNPDNHFILRGIVRHLREDVLVGLCANYKSDGTIVDGLNKKVRDFIS